MGFTANAHFCGGSLADFSLTIGDDEIGCGMETDQISPCELHNIETTDLNNNTSFNPLSCCEDGNNYLALDEDYKTSNNQNLEINIGFAVSFIYSTLNIRKLESYKYSNFYSKSPPLPCKNLTIFNQVFII